MRILSSKLGELDASRRLAAGALDRASRDCQSGQMEIRWPPRWQADAKEALLPYIGADARVEIVVGEPETSRDGSVLAGYLYLDGSELRIIYDRTGRADVYPWQLLAGPVLRIYLLQPRRKRKVLYAHPAWLPRGGD